MLLRASGSHDAAAFGTTSCRASLERKMRIAAAYSWMVPARGSARPHVRAAVTRAGACAPRRAP
eukprot:1967300-Pleurochrysis_carterae.AAC.1